MGRSTPAKVCPHCKKKLQIMDTTCSYCGQELPTTLIPVDQHTYDKLGEVSEGGDVARILSILAELLLSLKQLLNEIQKGGDR